MKRVFILIVCKLFTGLANGRQTDNLNNKEPTYIFCLNLDYLFYSVVLTATVKLLNTICYFSFLRK